MTEPDDESVASLRLIQDAPDKLIKEVNKRINYFHKKVLNSEHRCFPYLDLHELHEHSGVRVILFCESHIAFCI